MPKEITDNQRLDWLINDLDIDEIGSSGDLREEACGMACMEVWPHNVTDELLDRMYLKAFRAAIDKQISGAIQ